jgi:hypothetical protein
MQRGVRFRGPSPRSPTFSVRDNDRSRPQSLTMIELIASDELSYSHLFCNHPTTVSPFKAKLRSQALAPFDVLQKHSL